MGRIPRNRLRIEWYSSVKFEAKSERNQQRLCHGGTASAYLWCMMGLGLIVPIFFVHPVCSGLVGLLLDFLADVDAEVGTACQELVFVFQP